MAQIRQNEELITKVKNYIAPVNTIRMDIIKECLALVGEFGSITIWAPAKFAPMSREMMPNESIVINLDVKRVAKGVEMPALPQKPMQTVSPSNASDKAAIKPQPGKPVPVKIVPVKK